MNSNPRSFVTTNAIVVFTLLIGFANNVAIAAFFGLTRRVDAFYAAQVLPNLFMVLCIDYLGKNFLPMFAKARKEGAQTASELTSSVVTMASLLALCVTLILSVASPFLFRLMLPGFDAAGLVFVQHDFWIMAPSIVLMTITAFHQYVCQHDEDYMRITAIRASLPVANLAAIVIASPFIGEYALPVGWLTGQIVVFIFMTRHATYRYTWRMSLRRDWELKIFSNSAIVMSSGLIARSRVLVANYLASLLGGGVISALAMSGRITDPLGRTIFMTVRLMMFSQAARLAVNRESHEIARLYHIGLGAGFLLLAPLLWWMGFNAHVLVQVLFMRGEFDVHMAALVSLALIGAVPSVLFSDVNAIMSNGFYALGRVLVPAVVMPLGTVLYCAFAVPLSIRYGVIGMTASVSAAGFIVFIVMAVFLSRQLAHFSALRTLGYLARYVALGGAAVGIPYAVLTALGAAERPTAALSLIVGTGLYALILVALRDPVLIAVWRFARRAIPVRAAAGDAPFEGR
jgi:putative peptidoglycan lipid II flippase